MGWLSPLFRRKSKQRNRKRHNNRGFVLRQDEFVLADDAFEAWTSGELGQMLKAVNTKTNLIDRHFLLQSVCRLIKWDFRSSELGYRFGC